MKTPLCRDDAGEKPCWAGTLAHPLPSRKPHRCRSSGTQTALMGNGPRGRRPLGRLAFLSPGRVNQHHAVPAGALCPVKGRIGAVKERAEIAIGLSAGAGADAYRALDRHPLDTRGRALERRTDRFRRPHRRGLVGAGQDCRKLLASHARHEAAAVELPRQGFGKDLQHVVTEPVAVGVVDILEVVEIEQEHGGRSLLRTPLRGARTRARLRPMRGGSAIRSGNR